MFVELDTDTTGACFALLYLAQANILDCRRDPSLLDWINGLLSDPQGIIYGREKPDVWSTAAAERFRQREIAAGRLGRRSHLPESRMCAHRGNCGSAQGAVRRRIRQDCEDIAAEIACSAHFSGLYDVNQVAVTQPGGKGVSHAYNVLRPRDPRMAYRTPTGKILEWGTEPRPVDGAAFYGMRDRKGRPPPLSWYGQGQTTRFDVTEPIPAIVVP